MQAKTLEDIDLTLVLVEGDASYARFTAFFASMGPRPTRDVLFYYKDTTITLTEEEESRE